MKTKLLDCTIRDGGYINNWNFTDDFVNNLINALDNVNYDYIELGYCYRENIYSNILCGKWRNININNINIKKKKIKFAIMCDNKEFKKELFNSKNENIDLIRIAFHKNELENTIINANYLKSLGYNISLNAMGTITYTDEELKNLCDKYIENKYEYIYIADTYGGMYVEDIKKIKEKICEFTDNNVKLGFHSHNNIQNGINNVFYCIDNGFDIIDTTVLGMGRGAGNAQTELLLCKLYKINNNYNPYSIIKFINEHMRDICLEKKNYLPYLIGGYLNCHPSYVDNILEHKITDYCKMWQILEKISTSKKNNVFNKEYLSTIIMNF
jgi:4-hydroxy 2-oxovalerate aldolase